eukprot:COSAG01_NODE_51268_length_355_cov_0.750973_1_plen_47_part_10
MAPLSPGLEGFRKEPPSGRSYQNVRSPKKRLEISSQHMAMHTPPLTG